MGSRRDRDEPLGELERAAAFRSELRRFVARTEEVASATGLTSRRYDLLLAIKSGARETSTVTDLSRRLTLRQTAVTEPPEGDRRLMEALLGLREERSGLTETLRAVGVSFRAFARSQDEAKSR